MNTLIPSLLPSARIRYYQNRGGGDREAKPPRNNELFCISKGTAKKKEIKKASTSTKKYRNNIYVCLVCHRYFFSFINYLFDAILKEVN